MFYVEKDNKIVLFNESKSKIETSLKFMPQYKGIEIKETDRPIDNFEWADTQEYIKKKKITELEEKIASLESETGMVRAIREGILAEGSLYSEYVKSKAQEIETLANELRELLKGEQDASKEG